jgi:hypothetical protein
MRPDGQTDMTKLIVAFRNFANAPKNRVFRPHSVYLLQTNLKIYNHYSPHKFNRLGRIFKRNQSVFCAVRTESL